MWNVLASARLSFHICFLVIYNILAGTRSHNSEECAEAGSRWDLSIIVKLPSGTFLGLSIRPAS